MNQEVIQDIGKIFIALITALIFLGLLSDAGLTGLTVASTPPEYIGPEKFQIQVNSQLSLDLNEYFIDNEDMTFLAAEASNLTVDMHNSILIITPDKDFLGHRMLTIYASNTELVSKRTVRIEVVEQVEEPPRLPAPLPPPQLPPQPQQAPVVQEPQEETPTIMKKPLKVGAKLKDKHNKYAGKKLEDDPEFETFFDEITREQEFIKIRFYHNSDSPELVWVEGDVNYELSAEIAEPHERITLIVYLVEGIVPKFKLHIGSESDVFEFGKTIPDVSIEQGYYQLEDRPDEKISIEIEKDDAFVNLVVLDSENIDVKIRPMPVQESSTEVIAVEGEVDQAQINLPKYGEVKNIFKCEDFLIDTFTCLSGWTKTDISFIDHGDYVTFTVDSFSGYFAGAGLNLVIWDTTDIPGGTTLKNQQIDFYANFTNSSGLPANTTNGSCRIDTGSGFNNMTYNATSKLHEYNESFGSAGVFNFTVNCTGSSIQGTDTYYVFDSTPSAGLMQCSVDVSPCAPGKTAVLELFNRTNSHAALPNQSWGNFSICCQDVYAINPIVNTNASNATVFLKLFQQNNSHVELPNQTNYNISAFIGASNDSVVCDYVKTYGNCSVNFTNLTGSNLTNATCLATVSTNATNSSTNLHIADCTTNPYETSVCCGLGAVQEWELIILVDGNQTNNMTNAGEPYNITAIVKHFGVPTAGIDVLAEECNGIAPFAFIQAIESNVTNCGHSLVKTGPNGSVSYTNVPTGGEPSFTTPFDYTVNFYAVVSNVKVANQSFTVINRAPPPAFSRGNITQNKPNVEGTNERILVVFDRISRSRIVNDIAGEIFDMTVYDNGTSIGTNVNLTSGRPTGINITVLNSTTLSGIPNVTITMREDSGLLHWALIQYTQALASTNVSNYVEGQIKTDNNGSVRFTIIPTAGFPSSTVEQSIGNYTLNMSVALPGGATIFTNTFNVDRSLPPPSPNVVVPNSGHIEGFNEKKLVLFDRVTKYIQ